jgi:hypothetical protein
MQMVLLYNTEWNAKLFDRFDAILLQWAIQKSAVSVSNTMIPNYVFEKLKSDFHKENDFLMYINSFLKGLKIATTKEANGYPRVISNLLEIGPKQKHYDKKAISSLIFSFVVFVNAHNKWIKKLQTIKQKVKDELGYKNERAYCHFSYISNELKLALQNYRYSEDFILALRLKMQQELTEETKEEFRNKCFPIILCCGLPPQKEWTIRRVFNVIDADHGGTRKEII